MTFDFSLYDNEDYGPPSPAKPQAKQDVAKKESADFVFEDYDFSEYEAPIEDKELSWFDTVRDIGEQAITKGVTGASGAYGNILDAFGLQLKEGETLPGQEAVNSIQLNLLQKMENGYVPTWNELMLISDDDYVSGMRLPTSKEQQKGIEEVTGIGEGKTPTGRISGNVAQFVGEGAAFGAGKAAQLGLAGGAAVGQGIRELGGPEWAASGSEIAGSLAPSLISKKLIPTSKASKEIVEAGRKLGLSESQITPLIQGEKKAATLSKVAKKGSRTKKLFEGIKEKLGDSYNTIKNSKDAKVKIPNADQISLRKEFGDIRNHLSKTLAPSAEKEEALKYIEKSLDTLRNIDVTPEHLVNFWQDVNKSVKWNSISGGKKALAELKEPVSKILKKVSPQLAEDFEMTNKLYSKYAQISRKLKPDMIDSFLNKVDILAVPAAGFALATGNIGPLTAIATKSATSILAREMLINPYFQNIGTKLVTNFNQGSVKAVTQAVTQTKEYLQRKYPKEDWDFLTDDSFYED